MNVSPPGRSATGCCRPGRPGAGRLLAGCLCLLSATLGPLRAQEGPHAGFLFDRFPLTLGPGHRTEALGPFFSSELKEEQRTWAVPPLLSRTWDPTARSDQVDFAYPLFTYHRIGTEYRWQLVQFFSFSGGLNAMENTNQRLTLFPVYFQQRSPDPSQNYTAVFPFYGHLKNRLFRDEIFFVMFPIYGQSRRKNITTDNYLYPIFSRRRGEALSGWSVWPLAGYEHKDPTLRTNGFGEPEVVGGFDNRYALWPIFSLRTAEIGTDHPQREQAVLPFYSYLRSAPRDSTTVLWPLFTHVTDREKQYEEWETPWPLIVFARGEGKTTSRVWPIYSRAQNTNLESGFFLWPIFKYNRVHAEALDRKRTRILFFVYSDEVEKNVETGEARLREDFWPLYTHSRDFSGATRFHVFSLLEPFLPRNESIERDYSPLWSLWRTENNPRTRATSQSALWNLYRRETTPQARKTSFLFGLYQYQSGAAGKGLRLFYIPLIKPRPGPAAPEPGGESRAEGTVSAPRAGPGREPAGPGGDR